MNMDIVPGRYIVAVSGGVDSMTLLDLLKNEPRVELVVAHFDHGIRADSVQDRELVQRTAKKYRLPFEYQEGRLGPEASEAAARKARYEFLERVKAKYSADAIITAHHQDDLLETAILNLLRGTGRKGLTSLMSRPGVIRPLLSYQKQEILKYAREHDLAWREDSTNADDTYLRNYVRHHIIPELSDSAKRQFLEVIDKARVTNQAMDEELASLSQYLATGTTLERRAFAELPHSVAKELLATWLRQQGIADFDRATLERVTIAAKTKPPGTHIDLLHGNSLLVAKEALALRMCER